MPKFEITKAEPKPLQNPSYAGTSTRRDAVAPAPTRIPIMTNAFGVLLDSGVLWLGLGAVICVFLGVGAVRRLFAGAAKAEPPDPPERRHKR